MDANIAPTVTIKKQVCLRRKTPNKTKQLNACRKITACVFFLAWSLFSFSQNWLLVNPNYIYNYYTSNPSVASASIWIDSTKNNNTFFLNRIIAPCDTCISAQLVNDYYDTSYVLSNQPSFLQRKLTALNKGVYSFTDPGNIVIHIADTLYANWLFDSSNNIYAQLISKAAISIFSSVDSIQLIKLSSGDTIIVSKNYGILQYPIAYTGHAYYRLAGIEGINKGLQTLKFKDFFNFSVGDVFQYATGDNNFIFYPPLFTQGIKKIQILKCIQHTDTISYQVKTTLLDSQWVGGYKPVYTYSTSTDTIIYIDSANHFTNLYAKQMVPVVTTQYGSITTPAINQLQVDIDAKGLAAKRYGITCPNIYPDSTNYGVASSVDTINPYLYLIRNEVLILGREAKAGLGITSDVYNNNDEAKTICLTGYVKGTDTVGIVTPDAQLMSIATNKSTSLWEIILFPNPAHESCTIQFSSLFSGSIEIYDNAGQRVFLNNIANSLSCKIDISNFSAGIYLVKCSTQNSFITKKIIIQ